MASSFHAVVFGASGICGWALVKELLSGYPSAATFQTVTVVLNRSMSISESQWPDDERLTIVDGVNLMHDEAHLYYAAYRQDDKPVIECQINTLMLRNAVKAIEAVSSALTFVTLITGTKAYGLQMLDFFPYKDSVPLSESLPRIPLPYAQEVFYYHQVDALKELSNGRKWKWCEIRPDVIVGLAPIGNAHCIAQTMGIYLSLYSFVEGPNAEVPFPGNLKTYTALSSDSNQKIIARFTIYASMRPDHAGGRAFNIADTEQPSSWAIRWPILAEYFGLVGVGPSEAALHPTKYVELHQEDLQKMCLQHKLKFEVVTQSMKNPGARLNSLKYLGFDRTLDLTASRSLGFDEELDVERSWYSAFEKLEAGRMIPARKHDP